MTRRLTLDVLPLKPTIRCLAAAQDSFQRWWASSPSTLAHVRKCGKVRRSARAREGRLTFLYTFLHLHLVSRIRAAGEFGKETF